MVREYRRATRRRVMVLLHAGCADKERVTIDAAVDLTASLVAWTLRQEAAADLLVAAARPIEMRVGEEGRAIEAALDALAPIEAATEADEAALMGGRLEHVGAACLVFAGWDERRAVLLARARASTPHVHAFLVTRDPKLAELGRTVGARILSPAEVASAPLEFGA